MEGFDFDRLNKAFCDINTAIGMMSGGAALLTSVQQKGLDTVSALAGHCQRLQKQIEEKDARIAELEAMLKATKEQDNG